MGLEAKVTAHYRDETDVGKAMLESRELVFRGGHLRVRVPTDASTKVQVTGDTLTVRSGREELTLDLGEKAASKWAQKITHPKSRIEKLEAKPGSTVVLRIKDPSLTTELKEVGAKVARAPKPGAADLVFWRVADKKELADLKGVASLIKPTGAVWVVYPKGTTPVKESDVMEAARRASLVDTKVVAYSDTESALKLMVPRDRR